MLRKTRVRGFTLLECLLALLVIAGSMTVYHSLTRLTSHHIAVLSDNTQDDWLLFCQQLRKELDGTELIKVENNRLYIRKGKQELAFGKSAKDDFRKTNASGRGYQPMLYAVKSSRISQSDEQVRIDLLFDNGMERTFYYAFETS